MDANVVRIAIASLTQPSGFFTGYANPANEKLGVLPESDRNTILLASALGSGGKRNELSHQKQIENIFSSLSLSRSDNPPGKIGQLPLKKLALGRDFLFPNLAQASEADITRLRQEFQKIGNEGLLETKAGLEYLLSSLQGITWCVPSSSDPRISHFDHQRITAALAVCIQELGGDKIQEILKEVEAGNKGSPVLNQPVALLVGGDISGIQDFIYTITAKGAAKSLRGRSFYLQLMTEAILRFVLRRLDLPYTNVIYSGGGHFFLLAPISSASKLDAIQVEITSKLWKHHRRSLYLALGHTDVPASGFLQGNFPEYWGKMHASIGRRKLKRYSELDGAYHKTVFAVPEFGGNPDETCSICGEDHRKTRKWDDLDTQERICKLCDSFIEEIGKRLPKSRFLVLGFGEPRPENVANASDALSEFGMQFQFVEGHKGKVDIQAEQIVLWALDDPEEDQWPQVSGSTPKWLRYTANHIPEESFDELQDEVKGGYERLGVLRMDVDDLGELFKRGFGKHATITSLASLSFRVSLFFEGWLKALCEKKERRGLIYTVYSGGDDVFLIGPWDLVPNLAQEIVRDFAEYTGYNPDVHISAGMAFIHGKYPVYQAAEDAKEAIDGSKRLAGKNAFTFIDMPWKWDDFERISQKKDQLGRLVLPQADGRKSVPQAILQVLQELAVEEQQHEKVKGRHVWGRWIWMGMYQLTRMQERNKERVAEIGAIRDDLQKNNYLDINQWGVAARWTELYTRKKGKEDVR